MSTGPLVGGAPVRHVGQARTRAFDPRLRGAPCPGSCRRPASGLTRARIRTEVRRGNWQRLASGIVLTRPDPPTRSDWADVGIELAGPSAALSGWDALRVRGLGAPISPDPNVLVLTRHGANRVVGSVRIRRTTRPFERRIVSVSHPDLPLIPIVSVPGGR